MNAPTNRKTKNMNLPTGWTRLGPGRYSHTSGVQIAQYTMGTYTVSLKGKRVATIDNLEHAFMAVDFASHKVKND